MVTTAFSELNVRFGSFGRIRSIRVSMSNAMQLSTNTRSMSAPSHRGHSFCCLAIHLFRLVRARLMDPGFPRLRRAHSRLVRFLT